MTKKKKCSKCYKTRLIKFFIKDRRYRGGRFCWCKDCQSSYAKNPEIKEKSKKRWKKYMEDPKNREYERLRSRRKYWRDPKKSKDYGLRRQYGISLKKFEKTKRCLLCRRECRLIADHNHKTNKYRGAICHLCNLTVGQIENHRGWLKRVREYLKRG